MSDLKGIVRAAHALRAENEERPLLLATVVNVAGSATRRIGARMLITENRWVSGRVGGDCPGAEVIRKAWWFTRDGSPALLSYVSKGDEMDWGIGLESNGLVDLLLEPCDVDDPFDPVAFLESCLVAEKRGVVATILRPSNRRVAVGDRLQIGPDGAVRSTIGEGQLSEALASRARAALESGRSEVFAEGGVEALVEVVIPPPHLYLFGAGADALPLATLAGQLGWLVTVCDDAGHPWTAKWFAGADEIRLGAATELAAGIGRDGRGGFAVVMTQDYDVDRRVLGALLQSHARHIRVLGSPRRTQRMLSELGVSSDHRVHGPASMGAGAGTPADFALAILAETQALGTGAVVGLPGDEMGVVHERRANPEIARIMGQPYG